jgi:WD40 repeat protein
MKQRYFNSTAHSSYEIITIGSVKQGIVNLYSHALPARTISSEMVWSPDHQKLAFSDDQGNITIWSDFEHKRIQVIPTDQKRALKALTWSPDSRQLAAVTFDYQYLFIWQIDA